MNLFDNFSLTVTWRHETKVYTYNKIVGAAFLIAYDLISGDDFYNRVHWPNRVADIDYDYAMEVRHVPYYWDYAESIVYAYHNQLLTAHDEDRLISMAVCIDEHVARLKGMLKERNNEPV